MCWYYTFYISIQYTLIKLDIPEYTDPNRTEQLYTKSDTHVIFLITTKAKLSLEIRT